MDRFVASEIHDLMLEFSAKLDNSIKFVKENCDQDEFNRYRQAVGRIMGNMLLDIMNPIYSDHPDLKPADLN
jgi:hypothetical protein